MGLIEDAAKIDTQKLFEEAQVLSSYEHLAAVFACSVEALAAHKAVIERARLVSEHMFMKRLLALVKADDKDAIKLWAEITKVREQDKTAPITEEERLDSAKVRSILQRR